jgi:hypothetical protein
VHWISGVAGEEKNANASANENMAIKIFHIPFLSINVYRF